MCKNGLNSTNQNTGFWSTVFDSLVLLKKTITDITKKMFRDHMSILYSKSFNFSK